MHSCRITLSGLLLLLLLLLSNLVVHGVGPVLLLLSHRRLSLLSNHLDFHCTERRTCTTLIAAEAVIPFIAHAAALSCRVLHHISVSTHLVEAAHLLRDMVPKAGSTHGSRSSGSCATYAVALVMRIVMVVIIQILDIQTAISLLVRIRRRAVAGVLKRDRLRAVSLLSVKLSALTDDN